MKTFPIVLTVLTISLLILAHRMKPVAESQDLKDTVAFTPPSVTQLEPEVQWTEPSSVSLPPPAIIQPAKAEVMVVQEGYFIPARFEPHYIVEAGKIKPLVEVEGKYVTFDSFYRSLRKATPEEKDRMLQQWMNDGIKKLNTSQ